MAEKKSQKSQRHYLRLEQVIGCKWSVSVLEAIQKDIRRPGALERHITGISTKVLSERLRRLTAYGLLEKHSYPEIPPRTEYQLTGSGSQLVKLLENVRSLDEEIAASQPDSS